MHRAVVTGDVQAQAAAVVAAAEARWQREAEDDVLEEAVDLLQAEHGRLGLIDRLPVGRPVVIGLPSGPISGGVVRSGPTVVVIARSGDVHIVPTGAIGWVRGAAPALSSAPSTVAWTLASSLRDIDGAPVEVIARGLQLRRARLLVVAADHLDAAPLCPTDGIDADQRISVPYTAIERVTYRRRTDAPARMPESGHTSD